MISWYLWKSMTRSALSWGRRQQIRVGLCSSPRHRAGGQHLEAERSLHRPLQPRWPPLIGSDVVRKQRKGKSVDLQKHVIYCFLMKTCSFRLLQTLKCLEMLWNKAVSFSLELWELLTRAESPTACGQSRTAAAIATAGRGRGPETRLDGSFD